MAELGKAGRAGSLPLIGGAVCLDFCNTVSGLGTDGTKEHLVCIADVAAWARLSGLLSKAGGPRFVTTAGDNGLQQALSLRTLLHGVFHPLSQRAPPPPRVLQSLNARLQQASHSAALVQSSGGFIWAYSESKESIASVLNPILRSAAATLVDRDLTRLKMCPGEACGWLFLDETKNANRVWCEMRVCGSRAKARNRDQRLHAARRESMSVNRAVIPPKHG